VVTDACIVTGHPDTTDTGFAVVTTPQRRRAPLKEEADDYPHVVVCAGRVRAINCRDNMQWIVQCHHGGRWRGCSYCRARKALIRCASDLSPDVLMQLEALPEWHP
jgi:hypothetical protein